MSSDYIKQQNKQHYIKLQKLLEQLPQFCKSFFLGIEHTSLPLTRINYAYDLNVFFYFLVNEIEAFKNKSVSEITAKDLEIIQPEDLEYYLQYLSYYKYYDRECSNNEKAKARKLSAVKCLFQYLFNKNKINADVTQKVKSPKLHEKEIIRLETDEIVKLLNAAEYGDNLTKRQKSIHESNHKWRDLAILTLFLGTGIRISECVGLDVEDVNFENNSFKVLRKGGNEAILYFSEEVSSTLKSYLKWRKGYLIKKNKIDEKALFISSQAKRISVRAVQNIVKKYSEIITPLKTITPHKLRSTYGTALYRETKDIYVVADVLGHKDVNTTKKHYAAISDNIRRQAASKVTLRDKKDD